ncbi:MAG: dockerin type I domain-containing protein [Candidatus Zixiibacteriota bacterium]
MRNRKPLTLPVLFSLFFICTVSLFSTAAADTCQATGDVNGDGITLSPADAVALDNFVQTGVNTPDNLWECNMNGDGYIDHLDVILYYAYLENGMIVFEPYGGYPVPNDCYPSTVRGATCLNDTCWVLSPENAVAAGGYYLGNGTTCVPNPCFACCIGYTGNVNCSEDEIPDISDISRLIDYLYISHAELCCPEEADVNASGDPEPDITDITRLMDHLYLSHDPLPDCP